VSSYWSIGHVALSYRFAVAWPSKAICDYRRYGNVTGDMPARFSTAYRLACGEVNSPKNFDPTCRTSNRTEGAKTGEEYERSLEELEEGPS
jgi:hypothetical protein